ncbi:MAG TPA: HlyD family secretion protein [Opitutaceae bacterium]
MKIDESIAVAGRSPFTNGVLIPGANGDRASSGQRRQPVPVEGNPAAFAPESPAVGVKEAGRALPWLKILAAAAILVAAGAAIGAYAHYSAGFETTDDAFLEGDVHPVSARINGTVSRVLVDDNAHVVAGQPLVEIDPADLNLAVQGSEAEAAQARAGADQVASQIAKAQADVDAAAARIAQGEAILVRAELDFHRMETLLENDAISRQDFDAARAAFDSANASHQSLIAERASDEAALASVRSQQCVAQAQAQRAQAALAAARLQASYTIVRSPSTGRVAKKSVEAGQRLQPGQPVMAVVDDRLWVVANFKENQLAHLRPGEKVRFTVDAEEGRVFQGVVQSFSPGTGAQFSLLPPDNSTGNFTKIVQRVPVKILFADESLAASASRLSPGLSVDVRVSTRE